MFAHMNEGIKERFMEADTNNICFVSISSRDTKHFAIQWRSISKTSEYYVNLHATFP